MIGVGRCMKAGFPCSRADVTNGRYDAIIDVGNNRMLRVQIKGTSGGSVGFTGGGRSGQQISREVEQRTYRYSPDDCDLILVVDGRNGDCYIIPINDIQHMGNSKSLNLLQEYKENWQILKDLAGV
ncbi:MAG: group I intron-associated PD-(D/E)XK endonuclease [Candidatus Magasanikbacteria bacterium]|nr:group I intron-associated PD-(D/E)XK endonuclease [Candidatus Magasanikbacteria bacterium]